MDKRQSTRSSATLLEDTTDLAPCSLQGQQTCRDLATVGKTSMEFSTSSLAPFGDTQLIPEVWEPVPAFPAFPLIPPSSSCCQSCLLTSNTSTTLPAADT